MKLNRRQLRSLIQQEVKVLSENNTNESSKVGELAFDAIKKQFPGAIDSGSGDRLSNDWMQFVRRNPRYQETLIHIWDHLIDGDDPQATKKIYFNDLGGDMRIANAITFYGRKIRKGETYLTGKQIGEKIAAEKERRAIAKNNAPPREPTKPEKYGGGSRYRPYGRST